MATELALRKAEATDATLLFEWANDPVVRQNAFRQAVIDWEEHLVWLATKLASPDCRLFVLLFKESPIGTVRFDRNNTSHWVTTIAIDANYRGRGLSSQFISLSCAQLGKEFPGALVLAYAKINNIASCKSFQKAGFELLGECIVSEISCFYLQRYV